MIDLSESHIENLHNECKNQKKDLYSFLKEKFPEISTENRLKYLSAALNDFIEEYEWDENDRIKDGGYSIVKFYPKK